MNERIIELAEQAGGHYSREELEFAVVFGELEDFEKFAKLIVKDIIGIVEGYCETSPEIYGLPLDILEHFDMELSDDQV